MVFCRRREAIKILLFFFFFFERATIFGLFELSGFEHILEMHSKNNYPALLHQRLSHTPVKHREVSQTFSFMESNPLSSF